MGWSWASIDHKSMPRNGDYGNALYLNYGGVKTHPRVCFKLVYFIIHKVCCYDMDKIGENTILCFEERAYGTHLPPK